MKAHSDTLVLLMAAGYGRRMGNIPVPKVMLTAQNGKPFIDDALSFASAYKAEFDFAILSRTEPFFKVLNDYIRKEKERDHIQLHYQTTKGRDHVTAFIFEYHANKKFRSFIKRYQSVILMPADHALRSEQLNLVDLKRYHDQQGGIATMVYSKGWSSDSSKSDLLRIDSNNRILTVRRANNESPLETEEQPVTSVGVWVLNHKQVLNPFVFLPAMALFALTNRFTNTAKLIAYFIEDGWAGGRDTQSSVGK